MFVILTGVHVDGGIRGSELLGLAQELFRLVVAARLFP